MSKIRDYEITSIIAGSFGFGIKPFVTLFDIILIVVVFWLAFKFNSFLPFLLLGLSPQAW